MVITRSQYKKIFKPSKYIATIIIQRNFKKYLSQRYGKLKNLNDIDMITQNNIKLIPRNEMLILNNYGCSGPDLIKWLNTFDCNTYPTHPLNRTTYNQHEMKKIISFGFKYIKTIKDFDSKETFSKILYQLVTKEILRIF